ncbi:MAG: outer membrane beta-barrel protein [Betaproteobacteria bacterium]
MTSVRGSASARQLTVAWVALAAACMPVAAQDKRNSGESDRWQMPYQAEFWSYGSLSLGRSAYDFVCLHDTNLPCDEMDTSAFRIAAGGKFNRTLGIEIGYVDLGDVSLPTLQGHTRARGVNLSVVAAVTLFDRLGANARIGSVYGWTHSRLRVASNSCILGTAPDSFCNLSQSDRGFGLGYGAGLSARITPRVELRLDWDRYRFPFVEERFFARVGGKRDVDLWSAGFNVLF